MSAGRACRRPTHDADHVAAAAQRFGQEDDITVLSITLAAAVVAR